MVIYIIHNSTVIVVLTICITLRHIFEAENNLKVFHGEISHNCSFLRATSPEQFSDTGHHHRLGNNVCSHGNWRLFHLVNKLQDEGSLHPTKDALFGGRLIYFATHILCE